MTYFVSTVPDVFQSLHHLKKKVVVYTYSDAFHILYIHFPKMYHLRKQAVGEDDTVCCLSLHQLCVAGRSCLNYQTQETKSQLSKTVDQILRDSMALPYFIQFTELRRAEHLVKFWLEAESFRSTSWSRIRAHSLNTVMHSSLAEPASPSRKQHENKEPSEDLALGQLQPSEAEEAFSPARTHRQASPLDTCSGRSSPNNFSNSDNKESYALHGVSKAGTPTKEGSSKAVVPSGLQSPRTIKDLSGKLMKSTFHSISRTFKGDSPPPTWELIVGRFKTPNK